jgi:CMP-N-acetylneuraminic acid synthetase
LLERNGLVDGTRVSIRERKKELCGDHVSMNLILKDDLDATDADRYIMTHTTNPLLSSQTISHALAQYEKGLSSQALDSLFGVTKYQTRFYKFDGSPINHDPNNLIRTQDLEPWYEENSCIYIFCKASFKKTNARIGLKPLLFEIPKLEAIDIDEKEDWFLANVVAEGRNKKEYYA